MHPILFKIGNFIIPTYGLLIMIGAACGVFLSVRLARRIGIPSDPIWDLAFVCLVAGFLGARILFIITQWDAFTADPWGMIFSRSGFVFLGGLVAAIPAAIVFIIKKKLPMWDIGDIGAPGLALAHAFGRIGCFCAGCCYGAIVPANSNFSFLGIRFPAIYNNGHLDFSWAYRDQLEHGLIDPAATASLPVYPSQLFESVTNFLICALLILLWRRRKFSGEIFSAYLMLYGTARFLLEFLRGDADRGLWLGNRISTSQIISLIAIGAGIIIWNVLRSQVFIKRANPAHGK